MSLYNLRSSDGDWRITKFDNDLNPESSYLVSAEACECPAGVRPTCRHRQMLPKLLAAGAEDSPMFYDFDHDQFLAPATTEEVNFESQPDSSVPQVSDQIPQSTPTFDPNKPHPTGILVERRD
jgi:hypothetical protein